MDYAVLDLETTTYGKLPHHKSDPFDRCNRIVAAGVLTKRYGVEIDDVWLGEDSTFKRLETCDILVGQNIKFDLLYLLLKGNPKKILNILDGLVIWDTMVVEYLLTGQVEKYASLDRLATKYGGTLKNDKIKEYWDNGVPTEEIPTKELHDYLKDDLINTNLVYKKQRQLAIDLGMLDFIFAQMEALLATTIMEYNGMHFDKEKAEEITKELETEYEITGDSLSHQMEILTKLPEVTWNPVSSQHMSGILYGGMVTYSDREFIYDADGNKTYYKTGSRAGEPKMRNVLKKAAIPSPEWLKDWSVWPGADKSGGAGVAVIENMLSSGFLDRDWTLFLDTVLKFRGIHKELKTYFVGYAEHCRAWGEIHPSYQHVSTNTGRLSCTKPNLQNVTKSDK